MNYPRIVFILNSNEFDGGSRLIYELVRELHRSIDVVIFIPIIPRYRLFVAENCKEMQPLKASIKKFLYCLRWVTLEIAYQKLNWVYDYKKLLPYRRCFFSPPKRFINEADKVVLNSWYHVFNFYELWRTQRNKFSVFHHHVENYSADAVVQMRREIFESSNSITLCKKSRVHIEQERLGIPKVLFLGINDEIFNVNRTSVERDLRSTDVTLYRGFEKRKGFDYGLKSLQEISKELSFQTGKPENYVMTTLQTKIPMTFAGSTDPSCYVQVKSIGAIDPSRMSAAFCKLISEKLNIPRNRIYISFEDVPASLWGWDGRTFG